jgi:hypothetical protein
VVNHLFIHWKYSNGISHVNIGISMDKHKKL